MASAIKMLVFAHVPPPHHGQSFMVHLMLAGFGGDQAKPNPGPAATAVAGSAPAILKDPPPLPDYGIQCYHIDARFSAGLDDVGAFRPGKVLRVFGYCWQAIRYRFRYRLTCFYYIPAPAQRIPLLRDWLILLCCRPFYKSIIFHWHAVGLGEWLATQASFVTRWISRALLGRSDLSVVLSRYNQADAERLAPRRIAIVPNGIPDPCPDFASTVLPRRLARLRVRQCLLAGCSPNPADLQSTGPGARQIKVLFLAHCTREKGLFDTLEGVAIANQMLSRRHSPLEFKLIVAGTFPRSQEQAEYQEFTGRPEWRDRCRYAGFLASEAKRQALLEADVFCFPTFYQNEGQPVNLIEALAFGLPVVTTRWRAIPELVPAGYPGLIDPHQPQQLADALLALAQLDSSEAFRRSFLAQFTCEQYWSGLASALKNLPNSTQPTAA